jgi:hypothetical protein
VGRWVDLPAIAWRERAAPGRFVEEHAMGSAGKLTRERDGGRAVRFRGDVLLKCLTDRGVESGSRLAGARFRTREIQAAVRWAAQRPPTSKPGAVQKKTVSVFRFVYSPRRRVIPRRISPTDPGRARRAVQGASLPDVRRAPQRADPRGFQN